MAGLDLSAAQDEILARIDELPYQWEVGGAHEAVQYVTKNGVQKPHLFIQFSDELPSARDKSFSGPRYDGYYTVFRVLTIAADPNDGRKAASRVFNHLIGYSADNVGAIHKEAGGGSFDIPQTNSKPSWFNSLRAYRFLTNISDVGSY